MMESNKALVERVVDKAIPKPSDISRRFPAKDMPWRMKGNWFETREWRKWNPIKSIITDKDIDTFETDIGLSFPPIYRIFLKYKHFYRLNIWSVRFDTFLPDKNLTKLRESVTLGFPDSSDPEIIIGEGLLPFADEAFMDAGFVCFDTKNPHPNGDMPVLYWDHDWIGTEKETELIFSSARKMFECLDIEADFGHSIFHSRPEKGESYEKARSIALNSFLECDPEGALRAKDYWAAFQD